MAIKKKTTKKSKIRSYRISRVLLELSPLGTMWRTAMFVAVIVAIILIHSFFIMKHLALGGAPFYFSAADLLAVLLAYSIAFVVYDALYVYVVTRYKLSLFMDRVVLFGLELFFVATLLITSAFQAFVTVRPSILEEGYSATFWVLVFAILFLPARAFMGVSYVVSNRKSKK